MQLLTKQELLDGVVDEWKCQYDFGLDGGVYKRLKALRHPSAEQINAIIGNDSWTRMECSECEQKIEAGVLLKSQSVEGMDALVCMDCLKQALALMEAAHA